MTDGKLQSKFVFSKAGAAALRKQRLVKKYHHKAVTNI